MCQVYGGYTSPYIRVFFLIVANLLGNGGIKEEGREGDKKEKKKEAKEGLPNLPKDHWCLKEE